MVWTSAVAPDDAGPVLPDGCMDLLWIEGRLVVAGADTCAYTPAPEDLSTGAPAAGARPLRIAGVRFAPGTAPALLGVPADALRDRRVDLADLWSTSRTKRLAERIGCAPDPATALEEQVLRLAARHGPADPVLAHIVARLDAGASVTATADEVGLGTRALHRRSLAAFGYGPKTLARILRMQHALALARAGTAFAETAARTGYADQAHLSRDVKELTGMPLGRLAGGEPG